MKKIRHIALATSLACVMGLAPQAAAQPAPSSSDLAAIGGSSEFVLPKELLDVADQLRIPVPAELRPDDTLARTTHERAALQSATEKHLAKMGHTPDQRAYSIAAAWADEAARGRVVFHGNAGRGGSHLREGTGNIYRYTPQQARERAKWLKNSPNYYPDGRGFGVATSARRGQVFVVEYFLN
ncbi:hypothetical protein N7326_04645 [Corynebacterium sp. ES2794-CONJ1]|uniref:hypothetical protein n=1 Tax=unclassified Corynebacterium TaxID=2624378 RepID=UPI002169FF45|nr:MULTISPECIES: hypothetical protein [unclassified Corynebacterium]MCS4489977.1 hypothetical protein [Corynebacterium sp. ES2775-CONJ]MCS4491660.1 hypothetical protein [Corynebacterium sp. ES2715-CONJ3]MCS4531765.1 hypothetical protein [Corynebacterium sp. ES2730-CONJ]MCU9519161.1 hypothetical protein [Corynebacterium sp. ES2794-CONJ1]